MRLRTYRFSEIGTNSYYYDDYENEYYTKKISEKCYLPANKILLDLIRKCQEKFKVSYLFSGVILDQLELYAPEVLESYKTLINSDCVNLLSGSYSNLFRLPGATPELNHQINLQKSRIKYLFGKDSIGFPPLHIFNSLSPDSDIRVFSVNRKSSPNFIEDHDGNNNGKSLTAKKIFQLINDESRKNYDVTILFLPYTLTADFQNSGLNEFLKSFANEMMSESDWSFVGFSQIKDDLTSYLLPDYPDSFANENFKLSSESGNDLQRDAFKKLYSLREEMELCTDPLINKDWLYLQSCDHFYFMNMDLYEENYSGSLVIPYDSPYLAYLNYLNILNDFSNRLSGWIIDRISINKIAMKKWEYLSNKCLIPNLLK
jgi:alpha-amylase